ncbi:hypothetical protein EIP91_009385 [Steccherinum ochraceum]|uniref:Uncharacterized protein n=1 Tax=Steccherinum ochraceum TaxID=92696 RepID=A0A4R0R3Y9_9APHY|nr:hypothetical protein EIP91_009385 [Steccherinum ochraceum]
MVPTLAELDIIAAALQSMLYGAALLMFILTMYILLRDRRRRRLNRTMIGASFALISLATAELGVNIQWIRNGFITLGPNHVDGIEGYFADVSEPAYIVKGALYNVQTLILDAVVIYRAYVVWQKWFVIWIPGVLWCGLLTSIVGLNYAFATSPRNTDNVFAASTGAWITAVYALTLATNVSATGLLAYRIWRVSRRAAEFVPSNRLSVILHVVLESGTIYSMITIAALITFLAGSPVVYLLLDLISPIISIVFNMIIVRVGLSSSRTALPALGIESVGVTSDLEFAATNPGRPPTIVRTTRDNGVELKSMTVDLGDCGDTDGTSIIDTKHGTLGTSSSESNPHKSRVSL